MTILYLFHEISSYSCHNITLIYFYNIANGKFLDQKYQNKNITIFNNVSLTNLFLRVSVHYLFLEKKIFQIKRTLKIKSTKEKKQFTSKLIVYLIPTYLYIFKINDLRINLKTIKYE